MHGLVELLEMIFDANIELVVWLIDLEIGTWVCLIDDIIPGILNIIQNVVKDIDDNIVAVAGDATTAMSDASTGIENVLDGPGSYIKAFRDAADSIDNVTKALSDLRDNPPNGSAIVNNVNNLQNDIPSATNISADIKAVISIPLNTIKTLLNESLGNWTMDPSLLPAATKEKLYFCSGCNALTEFFDVLYTVAKNARIVAAVVLVLLAILTALFMAWWEIKRYRKTVEQARVYRKREPMDVAYLASRPLTARTGLWISQRVSSDPKRQMLIRWCVAYATTYTALFVLSVAIAGAFSVICQFILMRIIQKEAPVLSSEVGSFVGEVVASLEQASVKWSNETNQAILEVQNDINEKVFKYVWEATDAINNTITIFHTKSHEFIDDALQAEPAIDHAVKSIFDCFMAKLEKVQDALTWIHNHAHVGFPQFPSDMFSAGVNDASAGNDSSMTSMLASMGNTTANDITAAVDSIVATLKTAMMQEGLIAMVLLLAYITYVFLAVAQAALRLCCIRDRYVKYLWV